MGKIITNSEIGAKIKAARRYLGLTQMQLAEKVGVSFQQIQKYEKGVDRIFVERLQQIANALNVPVTYFFEIEEEKRVIKEPEAAYKGTKGFLSLTKEEIHLIRTLRSVNNKKIFQGILTQLKGISEALSKRG